jgi:hypothetical protein
MGLLDRFRPKPGGTDGLRFGLGDEFSTESDDALYVHLAVDGGIFVIRGNGEQLWVDREGLRRELEALKLRNGLLLYSREAGEADPPRHIEETFQMIMNLEPPALQLVEDPHPEALVAPNERRTLTNN